MTISHSSIGHLRHLAYFGSLAEPEKCVIKNKKTCKKQRHTRSSHSDNIANLEYGMQILVYQIQIQYPPSHCRYFNIQSEFYHNTFSEVSPPWQE